MNLKRRVSPMRRKTVNLSIKGEVDEWIGLSPSYEINIFTTEEGELYYNLYPVRKGVINTNNLLAEGYLTHLVTGLEKC